MKQYTVYACETCGYESKNANEVMQHEADHLGLTVKEIKNLSMLGVDFCKDCAHKIDMEIMEWKMSLLSK